MTKREFARWKKLRSKGKKHFVLMHGVIGWGVVMAVAMPFVTWLLNSIDPDPLHPPDHVKTVLLAFLIFPIGGYIWGAFIWSVMEKRYARHLQGGAAESSHSLQ